MDHQTALIVIAAAGWLAAGASFVAARLSQARLRGARLAVDALQIGSRRLRTENRNLTERLQAGPAYLRRVNGHYQAATRALADQEER